MYRHMSVHNMDSAIIVKMTISALGIDSGGNSMGNCIPDGFCLGLIATYACHEWYYIPISNKFMDVTGESLW